MARLLPLLLVLLPALTGCVEAEEDWTFDAQGGGTYQLVLRWNADLWRRVEDVLGSKVMRTFAGRGFPLRPAQLRDGLKRLDGVEVTKIEERGTDTGLRELTLALRFKKLQDLLGWEVLAARTLRAGPEVLVGAQDAEKPPTHATLRMEPIARVPVLDRVAALVEAEDRPPPKAPRGADVHDKPPLERLGIGRAAANLVWRMLKLPLEQVRLQVRVTVPGEIASIRGKSASGKTAAFAWTFADLRTPRADRSVRLRWRLRTLDTAPAARNEGRSR